MQIIQDIFDFIFLDKSTRELQKINRVTRKFVDNMTDIVIVLETREEILKIKTKYHKEKVDYFLFFIDMVLETTLAPTDTVSEPFTF